MDLTWRDALSTAFLVAIIVVYAGYLAAADMILIGSTWATSAVILLLGLAGRVLGARGEINVSSPGLFRVALRLTMGVFGTIALLAGLIAVIAGSAFALKILVMTSIVTWAAMVLSHV